MRNDLKNAWMLLCFSVLLSACANRAAGEIGPETEIPEEFKTEASAKTKTPDSAGRIAPSAAALYPLDLSAGGPADAFAEGCGTGVSVYADYGQLSGSKEHPLLSVRLHNESGEAFTFGIPDVSLVRFEAKADVTEPAEGCKAEALPESGSSSEEAEEAAGTTGKITQVSVPVKQDAAWNDMLYVLEKESSLHLELSLSELYDPLPAGVYGLYIALSYEDGERLSIPCGFVLQ